MSASTTARNGWSAKSACRSGGNAAPSGELERRTTGVARSARIGSAGGIVIQSTALDPAVAVSTLAAIAFIMSASSPAPPTSASDMAIARLISSSGSSLVRSITSLGPPALPSGGGAAESRWRTWLTGVEGRAGGVGLLVSHVAASPIASPPAYGTTASEGLSDGPYGGGDGL